MQTDQLTTTTHAAQLKERLGLLEMERAAASLVGLCCDGAYMADLMDEVEHTRAAYVGAAVTEIASLRAALDAPLLG